MYTLNLSILLQQLLPPPWRQGWRYKLFSSLLLPIEYVLDCFTHERDLRREQLAINLHVFALEGTLSRLWGAPVDIEHRTGKAFSFFVRLPARIPTPSAEEIKRRKSEITRLLSYHKLAGTSFTLENIT